MLEVGKRLVEDPGEVRLHVDFSVEFPRYGSYRDEAGLHLASYPERPLPFCWPGICAWILVGLHLAILNRLSIFSGGVRCILPHSPGVDNIVLQRW
jgi:hypothetical protein